MHVLDDAQLGDGLERHEDVGDQRGADAFVDDGDVPGVVEVAVGVDGGERPGLAGVDADDDRGHQPTRTGMSTVRRCPCSSWIDSNRDGLSGSIRTGRQPLSVHLSWAARQAAR